MKFINFLKSRLIFNIFYCFWMIVNKLFTHIMCAYSKSKSCFNVKSSADHFHMTTKILTDFQICISVPLSSPLWANGVFELPLLRLFITSYKKCEKVQNMFKFNNNDTRTMLLKSFWCIIVNFEHISHLFLVFLLLTLNKQMLAKMPLKQQASSS